MFQLMVIEDTIKAPPHSFNRDVLEVGRALHPTTT
jgi:DNA-directed RNA polymerase subunit E'/Rpb7